MNGTFAFVYSGAIGVGVGLFTVKDGVLFGCDSGGGKYSGSAIEEKESKNIRVEFKLFVPRGLMLVQGTTPLDFETTRRPPPFTMPPEFGDGCPITIEIPPGQVTVMVKRVPDEYAQFVTGFTIVPLPVQSQGES